MYREAAMYRRFLAVAASAAVVVTLIAGPALAEHDHFIVTPNGHCHQVAATATPPSRCTGEQTLQRSAPDRGVSI